MRAYIYLCVCMFVCECMYLFVCVCIYAFVCLCVRLCVCAFTQICFRVFIRLHICTITQKHKCTNTQIRSLLAVVYGDVYFASIALYQLCTYGNDAVLGLLPCTCNGTAGHVCIVIASAKLGGVYLNAMMRRCVITQNALPEW